MTESPLPRNSWDLDPAPNVPTPHELQLAEELRRQLVRRLLGNSEADAKGRAE